MVSSSCLNAQTSISVRPGLGSWLYFHFLAIFGNLLLVAIAFSLFVSSVVGICACMFISIHAHAHAHLLICLSFLYAFTEILISI